LRSGAPARDEEGECAGDDGDGKPEVVKLRRAWSGEREAFEEIESTVDAVVGASGPARDPEGDADGTGAVIISQN
jgi:hypothetical protein